MLERCFAICLQILDEDQRRRRTVEQSLQQALALEVGHLPQIEAVQRQQIEGMVPQPTGRVRAELAAQRLEVGQPGRAIDHGLSVEDAVVHVQGARRICDGPELLRPVEPTARVDGHLAAHAGALAPGSRRP